MMVSSSVSYVDYRAISQGGSRILHFPAGQKSYMNFNSLIESTLI